MTARSFSIYRGAAAMGGPLLIIGLLFLITQTPGFASHPDLLSLAITIDLAAVVPLVYFLIIRKTAAPKTTVALIFLLSVMAGGLILPAENQDYLKLVKTWALPVLELGVLAFVVVKVRAAIKSYRSRKEYSPDFFTALKEACSAILPGKPAYVVATEIAVVYYGFINWRKYAVKENEFTYHKSSGTPALMAVFIFLIAIETAALHLLISRWSEAAAWVLTGLSVYTALQVFGFLRSLAKRPVTIGKDRLILRYGILAEADIPLAAVDAVYFSYKDDDSVTRLSPLGGLESPNVVIDLNAEAILTGLYGQKKKFKKLAFHLDDRETFGKALKEALCRNEL